MTDLQHLEFQREIAALVKKYELSELIYVIADERNNQVKHGITGENGFVSKLFVDLSMEVRNIISKNSEKGPRVRVDSVLPKKG